MIGIIKSKN